MICQRERVSQLRYKLAQISGLLGAKQMAANQFSLMSHGLIIPETILLRE